MSNLVEYIFNHTTGPRLIIYSLDGLSSASLYLGNDGILASANGGSISSSYAATSSYVVPSGYFHAISTASQTSSVVNTFQDISFDTTFNTSSDWVHNGPSGHFSCSLSGKYEIYFETRMEKSFGGSGVGAIRLLLDGQEISGSYNGETIPFNNMGQNMVSEVIVDVLSGSIITGQFATSVNRISVHPMPVIGSTVSNCSTKIIIERV